MLMVMTALTFGLPVDQAPLSAVSMTDGPRGSWGGVEQNWCPIFSKYVYGKASYRDGVV